MTQEWLMTHEESLLAVLLPSLPHSPLFLSFSCVCVCAGKRVRGHTCYGGGQRTACESQFSSTMWDLETKLGTLGLVASALLTELSWEPMLQLYGKDLDPLASASRVLPHIQLLLSPLVEPPSFLRSN